MKKILFLYIILSSSSLLGQNYFLPIGVNEQQKKDYMYALKISDLSFHITKSSEGICHNEWNIKFTNRPNNPRIYNSNSTTIYNSNERDIDNLEGIFFSNSEITGISCYAKSIDIRQYYFWEECDQEAIINLKINRFQDLEICRKHSVDTIGWHGGNEVRNKLSFYYEILPLHTLKTSDANSAKHLPIEIEIPLIGKEGFASDLYEFRYKEPGKDWKTLKESQYSRHSRYDYPHTIYTSASKIFGAKAESMIGKTIDFQIVSRDKDNGNVCSTSNIIPLIITKSAPFIGVIDIKNPLCYSNEPTATFTVKLGRKLLGDLQKYKTDKNNYLGETLKITIQRKDSSRAERPENLPEEESKTTEYFLQHDRIENIVLHTASVTTDYTIKLKGNLYYLNSEGKRASIPLYSDHYMHSYPFTITVPQPLTATATSTGNQCFGDTKGKIEVRVLGGTPPYKYIKNAEPPVTVIGNSFTIENLPTDTYTLTIADKNDCQILKNGKVSPVVVKIGGPVKPITIVNEGEPDFVKHVSGYKRGDGSITTIITGGTPKKNDLLEYTVKIESDKGIKKEISLYETDSSIRGFKSTFEYLDAGTYTLTIIDGNDCTLTKKITITEPDELIINSIEATPISCNPRNSDPNNNSSINSNGTLTVNAKGGVPTYRYVWKRFNKPYTETRNKTITDLVDGIYQVEVIDANENKAVGTYTLTYPDPLYLKVTKSEMTCSAPNAGQATAIASGGTPPYTYLWNTGYTGAHITGLSAGKYFVTVSDSRGCSVQEKVVLSYPEEVEVNNAIITPVTCYEGNDGKIALTLSGGKGAVNVLWYDAEGTLITQGTTNGGKTISGLKAGKYKAVFRDQSDCPALEQFYEVLQPKKTVINIPSQITICQGDSRSFDLSTAFPSATFRWTDSTGSLLSTEPTFTVSTKGNYKVEITDQKGCKEATTFEISQSDKILEVDFLAATNSYYNYTVKLVSLSHSITTQWVLPQEVTLIKEENGAAEVRFPNEGTYTIGLKGFLDGCEKTVYKTLWVEKDRLGIGKENTSKEVLIDDFGIFSNPNNGTFRIKVNLKRASAIKVYCIDILGREAFPAIEQPEGTTFDIPIENRRISAGQYLVILEAGGDVMVQKMIVNH